MRTVLSYMYLLMAVIAMVCVTGCNNSAKKLEAASRLVHERPDSAYTILREVDYNDLDADSLKAKYILTKASANVRVGRSLITDTLLNDAADYFISVGDTADWVLASQLLSGYDLMRGESETALRRLYDVTTRISNPELLWDTYLHLLELSYSSQDYTKIYLYADWLLNHTNVPAQRLKFATAKGASRHMDGNKTEALAIFDSIIASGVVAQVPQPVSDDFYCEYTEMLDGSGHSAKAIHILDSINRNGVKINNEEEVCRMVSMAQYYANTGNTGRARMLLDSINHDATKSVFEVYAYIGLLKTALEFKETGQFPNAMMSRVAKNLHRLHNFALFDRQTALESVIELNEDNYDLKLQRQRLWLIITGISLLLVIGGGAVYVMLQRRKQRIIEAEEHAETLERMLKDAEKAEKSKDSSSDSDKLKAALLRQLGIFKTFAGIPTQQSRDALKKISTAANGETSADTLVDWQDFYSMIDNLYDGFHAKLLKLHPDTFNDKEQQIIVLLKAGFSTKEIGVLTEQSSATIYTRKSVIRKKLGTSENGDIAARIDEEIKGL